MKGKIELSKGYGDADYELAVKNKPETIFRIGSLTKPFTATATMALVEKHKLSLDDSICRFIRHCPEAWSHVLVRHLLNHTSGIPDLFNLTPEAPIDATRNAIDKAIGESKVDLDSTPGSAYVYRNFNYMLLGYIIEVVTGRSWSDVLATTIFAPAGMKVTAYDDVWTVVPGRARGYDFKQSQMRNVAYKNYSAFSVGGLQSSTRDLMAFATAFLDGRIVQPVTVQEMLTPVFGDYGYGWQIKQYFGESMFNHSGGTYGFASHLAVYPREGLVIVILSNVESEPAKLTACNIASIILTPARRPLNSCPQQ